MAAIWAVCLSTLAFAEEPKPYPLTTCIVSDEPIDSMGKGISIMHEGQEIKLCCRECKGEFKADPDKFLKKLQTPPQPATE
ncbi:MAG: hypothetical protein ACKOAS_06940 [Verrucomicrobiota bacterium]